VITRLLPLLTDQQVGLVVRLMNAERWQLQEVYAHMPWTTGKSTSKSTMVAKILRSLDSERLQGELIRQGLAEHAWFGRDARTGLPVVDSGPKTQGTMFPDGTGPYDERR
jgi:hypothetical protein